MPDRVIRDEILDSSRYVGLTSDSARLLFLHFLLVADDNGNAEASPTFIRRRLLANPITDQAIAKMLMELSDADLLRPYEIDRKTYVHIPRFGQRMRFHKGKYPIPPEEVEDPEIKKIRLEKTVLSPSLVSPKTVSSRTQDVRREEKRREVEEKKDEVLASSPNGLSAGDVVLTLPSNTGEEIPIGKGFLDELEGAYPNVDPIGTLREIRAWCVANPQKRKTKGGMARFINSWFARVQNQYA